MEQLLESIKNKLNEPVTPEEFKMANDAIEQLALGMVSPISKADSRITHALLGQVAKGRQLSIPQTDVALRIARENLKIPQKIFSRMPTEDLLKEVSALSQRTRKEIENMIIKKINLPQ